MDLLNYSLIAVDLDGTAVGEDPKRLAVRMPQVFRQAHLRGYHIVIATGRPFVSLPQEVLDQSWFQYGVLCDGAELWDLQQRKLLWQKPVSAGALNAVNAAVSRLGLPAERIDAEGRYHTTNTEKEEILNLYATPFHAEILKNHSVDDDAADRTDISKINLLGIPRKKRSMLLDAVGGLPVSAVWCGEHNLEITAETATKASGVQAVCDELHISMQAVFALGDSGNDIPLLQAAGFSVAMRNAPAGVRAYADAVTLKNTDNGAALAIERYLL